MTQDQSTTPTTTADCPSTFEGSIQAFLRSLEGRNRGIATRRAYSIDLSQFVTWLAENNIAVRTPADVTRSDVTEYLAALARRQVCGVSRARKLASIREYFRFLESQESIRRSPAAAVEPPRKERGSRTWLRPDEYNRMLALAGASARDYAILQTFLQTGIRVSELCDLRLSDVDLVSRTVTVRGKGMVDRTIELEKKGIAALRSWLAVRPRILDDHLFLNCDGDPIGQRGVRKMVAKYRELAGITKRASCHSFRHTFGTLKAQQGVSPYRLQQWLGHANINTTQIYVHLGRENAAKEMEATSL